MCGIRVDGENRFVIAPQPGGNFTFAEAEYKSVYGAVRSRWEKTENGYRYEITIPSNCTATIRIGDTEQTVCAGTYSFEKGNA